MAGLAKIASELTGRDIKHVPLTDKQWLKETVAEGRPSAMAELLLGTYKESRREDFFVVDPTLEQLLGRPQGRCATSSLPTCQPPKNETSGTCNEFRTDDLFIDR